MGPLQEDERIYSSPREPLAGISGFRLVEESDRIGIALPDQDVYVMVSPRGELTDLIVSTLHKK